MSTHNDTDDDEVDKCTARDETDDKVQDARTATTAHDMSLPTSEIQGGDARLATTTASHMTTQEAMSVLLQAAMTSEPQESMASSPNVSAGRANSAILFDSLTLLRAANLTGLPIDERFIRAALVSQPVAPREPLLPSASPMVRLKPTSFLWLLMSS